MKKISENEDYIFFTDGQKIFAEDKFGGDSKEISPFFRVVSTLRFVNTPAKGIRILYNNHGYDIKVNTPDFSGELSKIMDTQVDPLVNDFISTISATVRPVIISNYAGWFNNKYMSPLLGDPDVEWHSFPYKDYFKTSGVEEQIMFIRDALSEGKTLGMLYLISVSSMFNETPPRVVYVEGPNNKLKIWSMLLASKVFIDQKKQFVASDLTLLSPLKNMTVAVGLFGEEIKANDVNDVFIENTILTPSKSIFNALSETEEGIILPQEITDIPEKEVERALRYSGCVSEFLQYYNDIFKKDEMSVENDVIKRTHLDKSDPLFPLFKSCMFLSYFYSTVFVNILSNLFEIKDKNLKNNQKILNFSVEKT